MSKWPARAVAAAALAFSADASAAPDCTSEKPQVGILYLEKPGPVTAYRRGGPVALANAAPVCVGDLFPASPASGRIDVFDGDDIPIVPRREARVPDRRHWIVEWLRSLIGRRRLFAQPSHAGGPMGDGEPGFALIGVDTGAARIGMDHRILIIPVNPMPHAFVVELYPPAAAKSGREREMRIARVEAGAREAVFPGIGPRPGRWSLVIEPGRIVGGFEMVRGPFEQLPAEIGRLNDRESVLAQACLDPIRNGLEAYLRLARTQSAIDDRALLLDWQRPKRRLSCATPPD